MFWGKGETDALPCQSMFLYAFDLWTLTVEKNSGKVIEHFIQGSQNEQGGLKKIDQNSHLRI